VADYYHVSNEPLPVGTQLECKFFNRDTAPQYLHVVEDAANIGPAALRVLMLAEELMALKGWGKAMAGPAYRELVYEAVRKAEFQSRPSRLSSVFLFEDADAADRFRSKYREGKGVILVCTIESAEAFRTDMNLLARADVHSADAGREMLAEAARAYWSASMSGDPWPEVLVSGRVVVSGQHVAPL